MTVRIAAASPEGGPAMRLTSAASALHIISTPSKQNKKTKKNPPGEFKSGTSRRRTYVIGRLSPNPFLWSETLVIQKKTV